MILATVSGGLDSTTMLWLLLREGPVHVHHVELRVSAGRHEAESIAMSRIVPWLRENVRDFDCTTSIVEKRTHPDIVQVVEECVSLCRERGWKPEAIARGSNAHDFRIGSQDGHRAKFERLWMQAFPDSRVITPIAHLTRSDLVRMIPDALQAMTWSCRKPQFSDEGIDSCGVCHACKQLSDEGVRLNEIGYRYLQQPPNGPAVLPVLHGDGG